MIAAHNSAHTLTAHTALPGNSSKRDRSGVDTIFARGLLLRWLSTQPRGDELLDDTDRGDWRYAGRGVLDAAESRIGFALAPARAGLSTSRLGGRMAAGVTAGALNEVLKKCKLSQTTFTDKGGKVGQLLEHFQ